MAKSDRAIASALVALAEVVPEKELPALCDRALQLVAASGSTDFHAFTKSVMKMLERSGAVVFATLTTPTGTVGDARRTSIVAALEKRLGKKVLLTEAKDPSLLAGATLRVGDERFDISLAGDLTQILRS